MSSDGGASQRRTKEELYAELMGQHAAANDGDAPRPVPLVPGAVAKKPSSSFCGHARPPDTSRPDERGALSILEPLFSDYRLGFFGPVNSNDQYEVRTLPGKHTPTRSTQ